MKLKQINKGYAKHKQDRIYFEGGGIAGNCFKSFWARNKSGDTERQNESY